jgi:hypothetical protein
VQLSDEQDQINWKWTADGIYTAKSTYNVQFHGSYSAFKGGSIWQAEVEGKHRFFGWLLIQCKILTADKLLARNWPCNPICTLCNQEQESASHLILHCTFAQQVWEKMDDWTQGIIKKPAPGLEIMDWWEKDLAMLSKKARRLKAALMIYAAWNIWKARNREVFEQKLLTPG